MRVESCFRHEFVKRVDAEAEKKVETGYCGCVR
jgi:hypothetical protein